MKHLRYEVGDGEDPDCDSYDHESLAIAQELHHEGGKDWANDSADRKRSSIDRSDARL